MKRRIFAAGLFLSLFIICSLSACASGAAPSAAPAPAASSAAAASEAASYGIPTIAVSQHVTDDDIKFDEGHVEIDFSSSQRVLRDLIEKVIEKGFPEGVDILNLNVPSHPNSFEPVICPLAERMYEPVVERRLDPRGRAYYWINGELYADNPEGTDDHILLHENVPTLTPLILDMAHDLEGLRDWYKDSDVCPISGDRK